MKRILSTLAAVLFTAFIFAQAPEKMSYQAVVRDASGSLISSTQIGMEINVRKGSPTGDIVYTETQTPTTNANGLVSIEIGGESGFSAISWGSDTYFIETKTAVEAPLTEYTIIGVSQLLSVPYALSAKTAETITGPINETDPVYTVSQAANITEEDITNLGNLSGTNTGDQDLSELATKTALSDSMALVRGGMPDISGLATKTEVDNSVALVRNDIPNVSGLAEKTAVRDSIALVRSEIPDISGLASTSSVTTLLGTKVDKEEGKGLSTNDYTTEEKTKLLEIEAGAEVNVNADWNAESGAAQILNKPIIPAAANGSETKIDAGTNVTITGTGTEESPYVVNASTGAPTLTIGQRYQGGIIFWLDATGQHGLIAATADQGTGIPFYNGVYKNTGTKGDGLYAGKMNTAILVAAQINDTPGGSFAAKVCADYSVVDGGVTYGDWYLPSIYELILLYHQRTLVGGFTDANYWSSTEWGDTEAYNQEYAYYQHFSDWDYNSGADKNYTSFYIRAIRAF